MFSRGNVKHLLFTLILLPISALAEMLPVVPLGGVYYDNLNDLTLKVGIAYQYERITKTEELDGEITEVWQHNNFVYTDAEVNEDYRLITIGWGQFHFGSNNRLGLSYGESEDKKVYGLSGSISLLFLSFKAGILKRENENTKFMLGAGIGF